MGTTVRRGHRSRARSHRRSRHVTGEMALFASRCFPQTIKIPARLRHRPLEAVFGGRRISVRLAHVFRKSGVRVLGDLHGRRVGDFAWMRNCGFKTLQDLDLLASDFAHLPLSGSRSVTASRKANATVFAVPKSVFRLRFEEMPITKRLANVARSKGLQTLRDLHGRTRLELLQHKACGWRTVAEIQQLVERAISGEFNVARTAKSRAVTELLTLLEQGISKMAPNDREFLLARICGMTFAEIGRRYGFTRAWAHQVVVKALGELRKSWGPRIPRLLEMIERRCLSSPTGLALSPALLERWAGNPSKPFHLSREAQVRLIAALDKHIPWRLGGA